MYIQIIDTCMYTYRIIADHTICVCHIACIIYHISYLIRHLSYVTYHMWHIICDISYVVCCISYVIYHISYVIYHISFVIYAIYHISHIISNISYIISYLSYKLYIYICILISNFDLPYNMTKCVIHFFTQNLSQRASPPRCRHLPPTLGTAPEASSQEINLFLWDMFHSYVK